MEFIFKDGIWELRGPEMGHFPLITLYHYNMGLDATKRIFGVSDKASFKLDSLTTETS